MSTGAFRPLPGSRVWEQMMDTRAAAAETATGGSASSAAGGGGGVSGWVTAKQPNGTVLLAPPHARVDAGERQQHMRLWAQRKVADSLLKNAISKSNASSSEGRKEALVGPSFASELEADEKGIAFAFGGCDPGTLHAKGQITKVHQVRYSIGLAGKYWLHVGLRQQGAALLGSPFLLTVSPGSAHAPSTRIPTGKLPLQGEIGNDAGCSLLIQANDMMGNSCISGGAPLKVSHHSKHEGRRSAESSAVEGLSIVVEDVGDGTYFVKMTSEVSGVFPLSITIDHVHVVGSPTTLTMLAGIIDMAQSTVDGDGLRAATAGLPARLLVRCKDRFGNTARRHEKLSFGVALLEPGTEEVKPGAVSSAAVQAPSMKFDGTWLDGEIYEIKYSASQAGDFELHVWCHPDGATDKREWLMDPTTVRVSGVRASPSGSFLGGLDAYSRVSLLERQDSAVRLDEIAAAGEAASPERGVGSPNGSGNGSPTASPGRLDPRSRRGSRFLPKLAAGEKITLRPQLRDEYGNASFAAPGALEAVVESPEGEDPLPIKQLAGLGLYELSVELQLKGLHTLHVRLDGQEISGSPFAFHVTPGVPVGYKSRIVRPDTATKINEQCAIVLETVDTYGNSVDLGGANVAARALGTGVSPCEVGDNNDGTYTITFTSSVVGECRVTVRLEQKEMAPVAVQFEKKSGSGGGGGGGDGEAEGVPTPAEVDISDQPPAASVAAAAAAAAGLPAKQADGPSSQPPSFRRGSIIGAPPPVSTGS